MRAIVLKRIILRGYFFLCPSTQKLKLEILKLGGKCFKMLDQSLGSKFKLDPDRNKSVFRSKSDQKQSPCMKAMADKRLNGLYVVESRRKVKTDYWDAVVFFITVTS